MRVLIAPQEFKESLTAEEAASAIADGIRAAQPNWELDLLPMSDGGPGFVDALATATGGERKAVATTDCLGKPTAAEALLVDGGSIAIVESAQSNGLALIPPAARKPLEASTEGVGTMIQAVQGASQIIIGVGGSATTDGGSGLARELGAQILDGSGNLLERGGAALANVQTVMWKRPDWFQGTRMTVASDVTNPLLGVNGAATIYGPQKGASPADVLVLELALAQWAAVLEREFYVDLSELPGAGAAGGLTAALVAFLGAEIRSGFDVVADATDLLKRLADADFVVAGEGSFDDQSASGKTTGRLVDLCSQRGKVCVVLAGRADAPGEAVRTLATIEPNSERSLANASELLSELAASWAREMTPT